MSIHNVVLFPVDPLFVPDPEKQQRAADFLRDCLEPLNDVTVETTEGVQFIHGFENHEGVDCPLCKADLEDWWGDAMEQAWDHEREGFGDLSCSTPCCGRLTSLNDLAYRWPAGFSRFVLRAHNPRRSDVLTPEDFASLEGLLGCHLRLTWEHY